MEEKSKKTNTNSVIAYIVIIILIIVLTFGIVYKYAIKKEDNKENENSTNITNTENNKQIAENNIQIIKLSDEEKIKINKDVKEKLILTLRKLVNIEDGNTKLAYNTNLIDSELSKFYIVWYIMEQDTSIANEFQEDDVNGTISVDKELVNTYYNKIFNSDMNDGSLQAQSSVPIEIKKDKLYVPKETGYGINPFELKANNLKFDKETKIYTLTFDFLMEIKEENNNYRDFNYDVSMKYGDPDVLEWPTNLNYAKLVMKYKKDERNNYQLLSLMFVK